MREGKGLRQLDDDEEDEGPWSIRVPPHAGLPAGAQVAEPSVPHPVRRPMPPSEPPPSFGALRPAVPDPAPSSTALESSPLSVRRYRGPESLRSRAMPDGATLQAATFKFSRYLPLFDPDTFSEVEFYQELEAIGYRQVLIGGTGAADIGGLTRRLKSETNLTTIIYPSGPESVAPADLIVLPDVMNSNAPHARPFGTAAIATAVNVAQRGLAFVPVAYFVMGGSSTAGWYFDAFPITSKKVMLSYATYARMVGYRYLAVDYEGAAGGADLEVVGMLSKIDGLSVLVSEDMTSERAQQVLAAGATTVITSSDMYEQSDDPLALAAELHDRLLRE